MDPPTTITGRYYKNNSRKMIHKPLIGKFCKSNRPFGESMTAQFLGDPSTSISFGPFYSKIADPQWKTRKEEAWKHVLRSSEEQETTRSYVEAIKRVQSEARSLYENDDSLNPLSSGEFIEMMVMDGCFMLQVAYCALGGRKLLGYPREDPIFGEKMHREEIKTIVISMFVVGNQLPLVVLKELMKQSFFQKVLHSGKWKRPMDLPRVALFDFLIVPVIASRNVTYEPSDLLHGLWLLLTGPRCSTHDADDNKNDDESSSGDEDESALYRVPNAMELQRSGITFEDNGGMGTRGIRFNKNLLSASLSLPSFVMDSYTKVVFRNLMRYEFVQQLGPNRREVCAYLQLIRELIRTPDDAMLLADHGIIFFHPTFENELPEIFNELSLPDVNCNHNLNLARIQIRSYRRCTSRHRVMWEKVPMMAAAMLLLIVVLLQILSFILQIHQNPKPRISFVSDVGVPLRVVKDALIHQELEL